MTTHNVNKLTGDLASKTRKVPSGVYLSSSIAALIASYLAKKRGHTMASMLLQWAVPVAFVGLYNKIRKSK